MVTVLGTLGFHPEKFLRALQALPEVEKVVLYHAPGETERKEEKAARALRRVRRALGAGRVVLREARFPDPWDVVPMLSAILEDLRREGPANCVVNLTGGTKAMAVAATLACLLMGVRAVYFREESEDPRLIAMPLPHVSVRSALTEARARTLEALSERAYDSVVELANAMRRTPATVSYLVGQLEALRAVEPYPGRDARRKGLRITPTGRVLLLVHRELAGLGAPRG